jgi:hypothetical protein
MSFLSPSLLNQNVGDYTFIHIRILYELNYKNYVMRMFIKSANEFAITKSSCDTQRPNIIPSHLCASDCLFVLQGQATLILHITKKIRGNKESSHG